MAKSIKNWDKYFLIKIALSGVLFFILLRNIDSLKEIWIINDEFGYWGAAAFFAGKDWSGLMGSTPYYAFGYGILLAPLYILFNTPEMIYQGAIILNVCLVCGGFWLAVRFGNIMFPNLNRIFVIIVAFLISLYPNTVVQSQIAWPETLLMFLFWAIINILINIVNQGRKRSIVLLALVTGYMYTIHQRTIGIIVSTIVVLFLLAYTKKISWKKLGLFLGLLLSGVLLQVLAKGELKEILWKANDLLYINDYAGQAGKVNTVFSLEGIKRLIYSFAGKLFYLGGATLLLNFWGGWFCLYNIKDYIISLRNKIKINNNRLIIIFIFLSNLLTYIITSIFLIDADRTDIVIYGRYNEIVIAPLIFCGVYQVWKSNVRWREHYFNTVIMLLLAVCVNRQLVDLEGTGFNAICSIGMFKYFYELDSIKYFSYYIASKVIIISTVYIIVCSIIKYEKIKKVIVVGLCIFLSYSWVKEADLFIDKSILPAHERIANDVGELSKSIKGEDIKELFYVQDDRSKRKFEEDYNNYNIKYLQFYLPDTKITRTTYSEISELKEEMYICIPADSKVISKYNSKYELIEKSQTLKILKR